MLNDIQRLITIARVFRRYRVLDALTPHKRFRFFQSKHQDRTTRGERVRLAFQTLGPVFIKLGQALSTRPDLIPQDIAEHLSELQDNVPPFDASLARQTIETALGDRIEHLFESFDDKPLASASIAQVHAAVLKTGESVVVKVLRPDIEQAIHRDMALLQRLLRIGQRFMPDLKRFQAAIAEIEHTLVLELDLMREASNSSVLRRQFKNHADVIIPRVYWSHTQQRVVTFERVHGTSIDDIEALKAQDMDCKQLARMGVEIFFKQVFEHGYFHADMHPGNIFAARVNNQLKMILVDFGIMGTLGATDKRYLAQNLYAFTKRDYAKVAQLHIESGWVPKDTRPDAFEAAIRTVCEPMLEQPIRDVSFGKLLLRLFQTAQRFNMTLQPQLVLLQKTILTIEGVGRQLDPELNVWDIATPIIRAWMKEQMGLKATLKRLRDEMPFVPSQAMRVILSGLSPEARRA